MFIVLASLLVISYLVNIWFIYYVCCKQRRRQKRHLTAVQQKAITRKKLSEGLENLALDCEECGDLSTPVKRENPVLQRPDTNQAHSKRVSREDGPTGVAADQQEQQQHVYQRLQSCVLDPTSGEYLEILEPPTQTSANQQPEMCTSGKSDRVSGYQSLSPQASESKKDSRKGNENRYEKLLLRNMSSDKEQASSPDQDLSQNDITSADEIPDYVEIIGDDKLAGDAMTTPTPPVATVNVKHPYETLKLSPGSSHGVQEDNSNSSLGQDQQSVQAENQEKEDYVELLPDEDETSGKERKMIASADNENAYEDMNNSEVTREV